MTPALLTRMSTGPSSFSTRLDARLRRGQVGHVHLVGDGGAAGRRHRGDEFLGRLLAAAIDDGHLGALGRQRLDDCLARCPGSRP